MKNIAVIYHSGHGNTEHFARLVVAGAQGGGDPVGRGCLDSATHHTTASWVRPPTWAA